MAQEGIFRALLDCRIVLRALRSLGSFLGYVSSEQLGGIRLEYDEVAKDLTSLPREQSAAALLDWAEQRERRVYAALDAIDGGDLLDMSAHVRFEGVLWLQSVRFVVEGRTVAPRRLLMIDDLHTLRRKQRSLLIEELIDCRPAIPVWLAERNIALGDELLSQGAREGRDLREYALEEIWSTPRGQHQFVTFAQNILDRRLDTQNVIPTGPFAQYLRAQLEPEDIRGQVERGIEAFRREVERHRSNPRYSEWLEHADRLIQEADLASVRDLYVTRILLVRDEAKRQLTLELAPLSPEELEQRDSSQVQAAAEIFMNEELKVPYYFGLDRLCVMASSNVEELLWLAAAFYEALVAKQVLRKPELFLSPQEQEQLVKDVAKRKQAFIPKSHTEGTRAQRLLDSIGSYCRERTFLPNAPYAPGVTGVRLSVVEEDKLAAGGKPMLDYRRTLRRVLAECVAENLLIARSSAASTSREGGIVFYLNRTLCAHYGLPLQMGGWQDVLVEDLAAWMERGRIPAKQKLLEIGS